MTKELSKMTDKERAKLFPIILVTHNPEWRIWYEEEKENILANVENIAGIYHYGSTAIPNIIAKPTVDILIETDKKTDLEKMKDAFKRLGYIYMIFGKAPSMMFVKGYTVNGFDEKVFHVHVHYKGLQEELLFRDYLINHPDLAKEYEALKLSLQHKFKYDRDGYTFAKLDFIKAVTEKAIAEFNA